MENAEEDYYHFVTEKVIQITLEVATYIEQESLSFSLDKVETKNRNDFVSYVDKETEKFLVEKLSLLIPGSGFITEEGTTKQITDEEYCWYIDPLDGTSNFIHGSTPYAISIALSFRKELVIGVIHEITRKETFYAWKGSKAYLNGKEIMVSSVRTVSDALIATGRPHNYMNKYDQLLILIDYFLRNTHGVRQSGSAATDLAYVACGRYDGRYEFGLKPWDMAAGILIIKQAGGYVCDFDGNSNYIETGCLIVSNNMIFNELKMRIKNENHL